MEGCSVRSGAESGTRSDEDLEGEGQGGDEIHDLSQLLMDAARLVQTAAESQKQAEGEDTARGPSVNEKTSHHKQLETVRNEEHMDEAFLVERRHSPRRSPSSSSADRLSPLLSDEEVNIMMPIAQPPSSKGSGRFTNKIIHWERTQEGSDSDAEATDGP